MQGSIQAVIYDPASGAIITSYTALPAAVAAFAERRGLAWKPFEPSPSIPAEAFATLDATHRIEASELIAVGAP